jgi:glycosyltransferase involved in cell wall biosynthesis
MRITWVTRSFLDYRVPVFAALNEMSGNMLHVIYSDKLTPGRVRDKLAERLGPRAIVLAGEKSLGVDDPKEANTSFCIPWQPGLLSAIARTRPDILIGDGFFQWTFAAMLYKLYKRVPLVVCYERTFHTERNAQWFRLLYRRLALRLVDAMCCNGRLCGEYGQWLGMPGDRITYGHMAADTGSLAAMVEGTNAGHRKEIRDRMDVKGMEFLCAGQMIRRKGLRELLSAWEIFENEYPGAATLVVVGDGTERGSLEGFCQKRGLRQVRFAGSVDYDGMAGHYAAADAFIIPTLEDNWSLVVPEAMASGLPVLCSKHNGCWPELVHHGENGWVFDPLATGDTVNCLKEAMYSTGRLDEMGQRSKEIVSAHTPENAAESIMKACRIAMDRRR